MPAKRKVSDQQLELLVTAVEEQYPLACGRVGPNSGPQGKLATQKFWDELAIRLNACGRGDTKSGQKWRQFWNEKKSRVKGKFQDANRHARGTGGGSPKPIKITPIDERIYGVLGDLAVLGEPSVRIPFDITESPPVVSENILPRTSASPSLPPPPLPPSPSPPSPSPAINQNSNQDILDLPISPRLPTPPRLPSPPRTATATAATRQHLISAPRWAIEIEERHISAVERISGSVEELTARMAANQNAHTEALNRLAEAEQTVAAAANRLAQVGEAMVAAANRLVQAQEGVAAVSHRLMQHLPPTA